MADNAEFTLLSTQSVATLYTPARPLSEGRLNVIQQSLKSVAARALLGEIDEYDWGADKFGEGVKEKGAGPYLTSQSSAHQPVVPSLYRTCHQL